MDHDRKGHSYFTKHLFRTGCRCPTKLYYKSHPETYPERSDDLPFIAHVRFNKRQLTALLRACFPEAVDIPRGNRREAVDQTVKVLVGRDTVLFNAAFQYERCFVRIPVLEKEGPAVKIYSVQTKAFDPTRQSLADGLGNIHLKWKHYLKDLAFQLYVIRKQYPAWKLEPYLVLPDKKGRAKLDRLDQRIANREKIERDDIINLMAFVPVGEQVRRLWNGDETLFDVEDHPLEGRAFEEALATMKDWYMNHRKVFAGIGTKCGNCEFRIGTGDRGTNRNGVSGFRECWQEVLNEKVDEPHIFDLIGAGNKRLMQNEIYLQRNVPFDDELTPPAVLQSDGKLTDLHRRVLQLGKNRRFEIPDEFVKPGLFRELRRWEYPIHFLDFEAGSFAVPLRKGRPPYHLVVFQYSCHTLHRDGTLDHHEWMDTGGDSYPNYGLVTALNKVPNLLEGTIVQYSGFERGALKKISKELEQEPHAVDAPDDLLSWLGEIIHRDDSNGSRAPYLADMSRMVKHYYYNIAMENSLGIKDVLRSVMEVSPVLRKRFSVPYRSSNFNHIVWWQQGPNGSTRNPYDILREQQAVSVGRGTEAMVAYSRLRSGSDSETGEGQLISALLGYCELDTLAMVMIFLHWKELLEQRENAH